ncbi:MAG: helix-turn-helix transcriptional regulator [Alphaproteobacteria bacterium]|nr:helix-turn-helix transcriptional regulator [Alphaproteobacteria bacterium]
MDKQHDTAIGTMTDLLGSRWRLMILYSLMDGTKRFSELKRQVGDVTQKVLTSNLKALEKHGLLIRTAYAQMPLRVEYTLTVLGESLRPLIEEIIRWDQAYRARTVTA